jgi:hypothetical protein
MKASLFDGRVHGAAADFHEGVDSMFALRRIREP